MVLFLKVKFIRIETLNLHDFKYAVKQQTLQCDIEAKF